MKRKLQGKNNLLPRSRNNLLRTVDDGVGCGCFCCDLYRLILGILLPVLCNNHCPNHLMRNSETIEWILLEDDNMKIIISSISTHRIFRRYIINDLWYQHDQAPPHFSRLARAYIWKDSVFIDRLICSLGSTEWPAKSLDVIPLDFFLSGYIKPKFFVNSLDSIEE